MAIWIYNEVPPPWAVQLLNAINYLISKEAKLAVDITALTAEVTNNTTVDGSIITLVQNLSAQLAAIASGSQDAATQAALNALVATLQANDGQIAAAVTANTPAPPTTTASVAAAKAQPTVAAATAAAKAATVTKV